MHSNKQKSDPPSSHPTVSCHGSWKGFSLRAGASTAGDSKWTGHCRSLDPGVGRAGAGNLDPRMGKPVVSACCCENPTYRGSPSGEPRRVMCVACAWIWPLVLCWASGSEPYLFVFKCSSIQGANQDGFIQRAINASNAYASIIKAVKNAERAAKDADEAAGEALTVCNFPSGPHKPLQNPGSNKLAQCPLLPWPHCSSFC